jgi:hypothetical protein
MKYEAPDREEVKRILQKDLSQSLETAKSGRVYELMEESGMGEKYIESVRKFIIQRQKTMILLLSLPPTERIVEVVQMYEDHCSGECRKIVERVVTGDWEGAVSALKRLPTSEQTPLLNFSHPVWDDIRTV